MPLGDRSVLATGCRVLVRCGVKIGAEALVVNSRCRVEQRHGSVGGNETAPVERRELADGHTVTSHDEALPLVDLAHDLAALVPELSLCDLSRHEINVARRATPVNGGPESGFVT